MGKRKQNKINCSVFNQMDRRSLFQCADILGVSTLKLIPGGITCELSSNQLRFEIARCLGPGTFPDRISRLENFIESWDLNQESNTNEIEIDPKDKVRKLIEAIRNNFDRLSDVQILELITNWIENPQDCCCYEQLDTIAETLGFTHEEINDDYVLVSPSPSAIAKKIVSMSDAEFYHSVVALAGLAFPNEDDFPAPSSSCAGYEFLENLKNKLVVAQSTAVNSANTSFK